MTIATKNDVGKKAIVVSTDETNGAEVEILTILENDLAVIKWPNGHRSPIKISKLQINE